MTDKLRAAAQAVHDAWEAGETAWFRHCYTVMENLEKALAEQPAEQSANPVGAVFQKPVGYLYPTGRHPEFRFFQKKRDGVDGVPVYTAPQPVQQEPVVLHQFHKRGCADWYDGLPDHEDGGGPYETRTLYTASQPKAEPQEPVALGPLAKRRVFDYIRGAYDLGYNDARNARTIPGDNAPGYKGRDVEADHGGALFNALRACITAPQPAKQLTDEEIIASNFPDGEENGPTIAAPDFELIAFARQVIAAYEAKNGITGETK